MGTSFIPVDHSSPLGVLILSLGLCPLLREAISGHRHTSAGRNGVCLLVVRPGSAKAGGGEAGCLNWEAKCLANWAISRERAGLPWPCSHCRCLQNTPLQPADFLVARLLNSVIYDHSHPSWPLGVHTFTSSVGSE